MLLKHICFLMMHDSCHLGTLMLSKTQLTECGAKLSSNGSLCGLACSWHDGVGHSHQGIEALRDVQHWAGQHAAGLPGEQSMALQQTEPMIQCTECRGADW